MENQEKTNLAQRLLVVGAVALFIWVFLESLISVEGVIWRRYQYNPPPDFYHALSLAMALLPAFWLPVGVRRPSDVALWFLYLMTVIPAVILPFHVVRRAPEDVLVFSSAMLVSFAVLTLILRLPLRKFAPQGLSTPALSALLAFATIATAAVVYFALPAQDFSVSVEDLYARRMSARDTIGSNRALAYALTFLSKSLAPLLIVVGLTMRRPIVAVPGIIGLLFAFGIDGQRTVGLLPVFLLLLLAVLKWAQRYFSLVIVSACVCMFAVSMYLYLAHGSTTLAHLFPNRLFVIKGALSSYYWDFFSTHPFVYFSDGLLGRLIERQYPVGQGFIIGELYFGDDQMNASVNLWASSYAQVGYLGMFLTSLATGGVLWIVDSFSLNRNPAACALVAGMFGIMWSDAAFHTSLLSNGALLTLTILYVLPATQPVALSDPRGAGTQTSSPRLAAQ